LIVSSLLSIVAESMTLLPLLQRAFPTATSYETVGEIVQTNAVGYILKVEHDESCSTVFLKQVVASDYVQSKKDWTDLRRTMLYARTEIRFYKELLPLLQAHVKSKSFPTIYLADYNLTGWIDEDETAITPANPSIDKDKMPDAEQKMGTLIMECISDKTHFQDSPLTVEQSKLCLGGVANMHAAGWQHGDLLTLADQRLSKASFHLKMRNPKELASIRETWKGFLSAFEPHLKEAGLWKDSIMNMGERLAVIAEYVSDQVSPTPTDPYATLVHGDYKSLNVFLPVNPADDHAILVDFASVGVGLGMSDLAMHIRHAVVPKDLENGVEEAIVRDYWEHLTSLIETDYPWETALRHYRLAVVDYW
jgi:hypothetical protein